ncbi:MAG TPA: lysylphosphatidylglycerol synthase transmembrane domain-containing protein [Verrucomicrobiae bacterium]|jgi:hypothetical protein|nr:lysylphosphatidylglycerol synthase transmembrane domain-containing protein [Verrucomicrobiae bacterium]
MKGGITLILKAVVAVMLLIALSKYGLLNFHQFTRHPATGRFMLLMCVGCGCAFASLAVLGWRLVLLLSMQGIGIAYARAFVVTVVGNLLGGLLPGIIAGDIAKLTYLCRLAPHRRRGVAAAILFDRLMGLYGLLLLGSLSAGCAVAARLSILHGILWLAPSGTLVGTLGFIGLFMLARSSLMPRMGTTGTFALIHRLICAVDAYRNEPKTLFAVLGLSSAAHALMVGAFICAAGAMRDTVPPPMHFVLDPLAMLLNALPISPGGLGLAEGAFGFLFATEGSANGALIGLTGRLMLYAVSTAVTLLAFLVPHGLKSLDSAALESGHK